MFGGFFLVRICDVESMATQFFFNAEFRSKGNDMTTISFKKTLHCGTGGSDKLYIVQIEAVGPLLEVCGFSGRRGSTLTRQLKGTYLNALLAQTVADNLVQEKLKKGYRELISPSTLLVTAIAQSGATSADDEVAFEAAKAVISLPTGVETVEDIAKWATKRGMKSVFLQQKMDGERVQLVVKKGVPMAWSRNRRPLTIHAPEWLPDGLYLDAELVDGELHPFQVYGTAQVVTNGLGLDYLAHLHLRKWVGFTELLVDENFEAGLVAYGRQLALDGAEGFIVRDPDAPLKDGRDPGVLKLKFTATADVLLHNTERERVARMSVVLSSLNGGPLHHVGDVTLPAGATVLDGYIAEVRYLYKTEDGKLQQPVFLRLRDDLAVADCTLEKLTRIKGKATNWGSFREAVDVFALSKSVSLAVDTRW